MGRDVGPHSYRYGRDYSVGESQLTATDKQIRDCMKKMGMSYDCARDHLNKQLKQKQKAAAKALPRAEDKPG